MCTLTWLLWSYNSVSSDGNIVMQSCIIIFGSWDRSGIGRLVDRATNLCALCRTWTFQVSDLETQVLAMRYRGTKWVLMLKAKTEGNSTEMHWETYIWILLSLLPHESLLLFRIGILIAWFLMSQWNFLAMQHLVLCSIVWDQRPFLPIPIPSRRQRPMTSPTKDLQTCANNSNPFWSTFYILVPFAQYHAP